MIPVIHRNHVFLSSQLTLGYVLLSMAVVRVLFWALPDQVRPSSTVWWTGFIIIIILLMRNQNTAGYTYPTASAFKTPTLGLDTAEANTEENQLQQ